MTSRRLLVLMVLASALVLAGGVGAEPLAPLPATFIGVLPCADCPGVRYHLNLFRDHSYFLRTTYLERTGVAPMDDIGVWLWSSDGRILILKGGREAPQLFALQDGQALRMLDGDGRPLPPSVPSELRRADSFQAFEPLLVVRGSYRYVADAGLFTDCLTRQRWPVAQESANAALESAYLKLRLKPDAPLVVQVHARVATRPKVEGEGTQATLVVQRFINAWPGASCGPRFSAVPLEGSRWTLVRLGGEAVRPGNRAAPALTVRAEASRVSGWGGCNMFKGSYAQTGDTIAFRDLDPRRPCPDGTDTETAFLAALERARKWRILGQILELRDAQDAFVARFEGLLSPLRTLGR